MTLTLIQDLERDQIRAITAKRQVPEFAPGDTVKVMVKVCLLYTSPSPRDRS